MKRPPSWTFLFIQAVVFKRAEHTCQQEGSAAAAALAGNDDGARAAAKFGRACRKLLAAFRIPAAGSLPILKGVGKRSGLQRRPLFRGEFRDANVVAIANEQREDNASGDKRQDEWKLMAFGEKSQNRQEWQPGAKQNEQQRRTVERKRIRQNISRQPEDQDKRTYRAWQTSREAYPNMK